MSWETILQNDSVAGQPLRPRIDALFVQQRATWPALREGEAALSQLQRKQLSSEGESIIVQLNPARRRSTLAPTDAKAVAARACFLCPENIPPLERGVAFDELVVLPNPYPILPLHCTIAAREHTPQQIAGRVATFLRLAESIGPDMVALYNGPRCGASAPDHFHFQAARADNIPILSELATIDPLRSVTAHASFGRNMLIFRGTNAAEVQAHIEQAIAALGGIEVATDEPMFNLLVHYHANHYIVVLFPRAAHRPACYFAPGSDKLSISPAILEMCGLLVGTEPDHFERIDAATARAIYKEVSLLRDQFERLTDALDTPFRFPPLDGEG
jgi:hypothetical protein